MENVTIFMILFNKILKRYCLKFLHIFAIISSFTSIRRVVQYDICNKRLWRWTLVSWKGCFCKQWYNSPNAMCFPWARPTLIFSDFTKAITIILRVIFFILWEYILRIIFEVKLFARCSLVFARCSLLFARC